MLGRVGRALLDRVRNFVGLAIADADLALAIADHGESGEGKATATLHDLGAAIDEDDLLNHRRAIAFLLLPVAVVAAWATITTGTAMTTTLSTIAALPAAMFALRTVG
jgi:hypothetical protein